MRIVRDLRVALRVLSRRPSFSVAAVVTLALGIGANVTVFSAVRAVLVNELPYRDADRLVMLMPADHFRGLPATVADVEALEALTAFSHVAGCARSGASGMRARPTVLAAPIEVTPAFFGLWGVAPHLGRVLTGDDFSPGARNAVVSFDLWRRRLAGDPRPLGKPIILSRQTWTIVGVMPQGFAPPCYDTGSAAPAWIPYAPTPMADRSDLAVVARLKPTVELAAAQSQIDAVMSRLAGDRTDRRYEHAYLEPLGASAAAELEAGLFLLQGVALLLLVTTCANLGNLFLVHTTTRQAEFAVRAGLGAGPSDLLRHVLMEAGVIAVAGAALGVATASVTNAWLRSMAAPVLPPWVSLKTDLIDLGLGLGAGCLTALAFGTGPALLAARVGAPRVSRVTATAFTGGLLVRRLRGTLLAGQVLLGVVLLAGAGLLIRSFINVMSVPVGFDVRGLVTTDLYLDARSSTDDLQDDFLRTVRRLDDEFRGLSPSWAVSFADTSPFVSGGGVRWQMRLPGTAEFVRRSFQVKRVSSNYLETLGIPLLRGQSLSAVEGQTSPRPVVVSAAFARTIGLGREVLGGELRSPDSSYVIAGVAGDVKSVWLTQPAHAEVYLPIGSGAGRSLSVIIRAADERRAIRALSAAASRLNPAGPPVAAESMSSIVARSEQRRWFYSVLISLFAFLAGTVAAVGVYGVVAQVVAQRSREIGVRTALGARPSAVVLLVMRQGLRLAALGVLAGVIVAWWTADLLQANSLFRSLLFQVPASDPWSLGGVAVAALAVSAFAAWRPARLAARRDPAGVLREP